MTAVDSCARDRARSLLGSAGDTAWRNLTQPKNGAPVTTTCRGCRLPGVLVDEDRLCHDCAREMAEDPELTVADLRWIMPGPESGATS